MNIFKNGQNFISINLSMLLFKTKLILKYISSQQNFYTSKNNLKFLIQTNIYYLINTILVKKKMDNYQVNFFF